VSYFTNLGKNFKELLEFFIKQSSSFFEEVDYTDVLKVIDVELEKREDRSDTRNARMGHGKCFI